jgi:tRNA-splicing ligase RtcB
MHFIALAKQEMERWHIHLRDRNLAYLPEGSRYFDDYMSAVGWAQDYAMENRRPTMQLIIGALKRQLPPFAITREAINCYHNCVAGEKHFGANVYVTRKGAIRARDGDLGIVPGSMGARSYIVRGSGNPDALCSCAHGAGRRMSRNEATRRCTLDGLKAQTSGVECRKDRGVLDEIPGAYKDIDEVMENQKDLVEVVHTLKQVLTVKGYYPALLRAVAFPGTVDPAGMPGCWARDSIPAIRDKGPKRCVQLLASAETTQREPRRPHHIKSSGTLY